MAIPIGMKYGQTVSGAALKAVTCEHCRTKFFYFAKRSAHGEGTSLLFLDEAGAQLRAADAAQANLNKELEKARDLAPCPQCGKFQTSVISAQRESLYKYAGAAFFLSIFVCVLVGVFALGKVMNPGVGVGVLLGASLVLCFGGAAALGISYDPNKGKWFPFGTKDVRQSMTQEQFEQMQADADQAEANRRAELEAAQNEKRERAMSAKAEAQQKKEALQQAAKARKEEEKRAMAERAKASNRRPQG